MTNEELDEALAIEVMGWHKERNDYVDSRYRDTDEYQWVDGEERILYHTTKSETLTAGGSQHWWHPADNLTQAVECLEMIIGECKEEEFIHALIAKLDLDCSIFPSALEGSGYSGNVPECIVAMMTAKPRAICEAVLMAKRGEG
jgi:hypothetical protein